MSAIAFHERNRFRQHPAGSLETLRSSYRPSQATRWQTNDEYQAARTHVINNGA